MIRIPRFEGTRSIIKGSGRESRETCNKVQTGLDFFLKYNSIVTLRYRITFNHIGQYSQLIQSINTVEFLI